MRLSDFVDVIDKINTIIIFKYLAGIIDPLAWVPSNPSVSQKEIARGNLAEHPIPAIYCMVGAKESHSFHGYFESYYISSTCIPSTLQVSNHR